MRFLYFFPAFVAQLQYIVETYHPVEVIKAAFFVAYRKASDKAYGRTLAATYNYRRNLRPKLIATYSYPRRNPLCPNLRPRTEEIPSFINGSQRPVHEPIAYGPVVQPDESPDSLSLTN